MGKTFKKAASAFLAAMVLSGMLAGCGSNSGTAATTAAAGGDSATTAAKETTAAATADLKPVKLKFYFFDAKKSATDQVWSAIAEKFKDKLNATFDVQFIAGTDYKDKLVVMSAAGDTWDMNFDGDWLSYYQMTANNAYLALEDLLPQYAPDLYKAYDESGALKAATYKGHVVALPWTMVMNNRPLYQWRKDLVAAKGVDLKTDSIKTVEDVDVAVGKLKAAFPDKKIIENADHSAFLIENNMIEIGHSYVIDLTDASSKVVPLEQTANFKKLAKYAKKWQDEGAIWKDILTDKLDHNQLIDQGQLITKWGTHEFANSARAWTDAGAGWDSSVLYTDKKFANRTPLANIVAISRTSKNPERTLMFMNLLQTDKEMYDMVHYGIDGTTYKLDGQTATYPDGMNSATSNYMEWGGRWALWKPQFMRPDAQYSDGFWTREAEFAKSNPNNMNSPLDGFSFDVTAVKSQVAQRDQIFADADKVITVGLAGDSDKAVDELIAKEKAAGVDAITAELQKQVDAFIASKK